MMSRGPNATRGWWRSRNANALRLQSRVIADLAEGVAVVRWRDSEIVYANGRMEELFGFAPGSLAGRTVDAIPYVHPDPAALVAACRETVAQAGSWHEELEYVRADGSTFWGQVRITGFSDPRHGAVSVSVIADITDRRQAQARISEQQRRLDESQSAGGVGSFDIGLDGHFAWWSDQQFRLHGLPPGGEPPRRERYFALVVAEDRAGLDAAIAHVTESRIDHEYRIVRPDGVHRTLRMRAVLQLPSDADAPRLVGTCHDVTEERAARDAQRSAEARLRSSFDEAVVGMQVFDLEGRYLDVNDAFSRIVGHDRAALVGRSRAELTHADDLEQDEEASRELLTGRSSSYILEKRYRHADGHEVWASLSVSLVRDLDGAPLHFIGQAQDITERRESERRLKQLADHDPLTGLLNRRSFERELAGHITRIKRFGVSGAVLMIDLDHFKYYNDTRGHSAGDALIVQIANGLRGRLRESDVLARLGGDEFAVLMPNESPEGAEVVAHQVVEHVRELAGSLAAGDRRTVTTSVGIASFDSDLTADDVMVNADLAMYEAKDKGRDQVAHYHSDGQDQPRIANQMKWAEEIGDALAEQRFELLAQPIISLQSAAEERYELLLRMRDRDGGLVAPASFLHVAERLGLIAEIDRWVVDRAITMLAEQLAQGRDPRFELNLSGLTVGDPEWLALVERRLQQTGVDPGRLVFEITETAAVANIARAASFADRLSELGCRFALDDFGAGFGSFYYLKHLPFDYLKIDGEFVRQCTHNQTDRTLIAAVVQIARGMGKQTIAEFVEDADTLEALRRLGVDYAQGYHVGRPAPLQQYLDGDTPALLGVGR